MNFRAVFSLLGFMVMKLLGGFRVIVVAGSLREIIFGEAPSDA
jgi:hypothetical protein